MRENQVVLVTGASSGIGWSVAEFLSAHNFQVFGTTRRGLRNVAKPIGAEMIQLDVCDPESVSACIREVLRMAGRIDALVNNAGFALIGAVEETSDEEAKELFETNFFGVIRVTRTVLPRMRKQGGGRIVNIGSVVGFVPAPYQAIYCASKHAIEGFSESLDHEVRQFGVRVSVVEPGFTRTDISRNGHFVDSEIDAYSADRNRVAKSTSEHVAHGAPSKGVAEAVLEALISRSPKLRYPVGKEAKRVSRLPRFAPSKLFDQGIRREFELEAV